VRDWAPIAAALAVAGLGGALVFGGVRTALLSEGGVALGAQTEAQRAVVLDFSDGLVRDQDAITRAYAAACEEGWEPACRAEQFRGDLMEAERALDGRCSDADPASCLVLGWARTQRTEDGLPTPGIEDLVWDGVADYVERDYAGREWRGADAFDTACHAGYPRACAELGRCMGWGLGREHSWAEAEVYLRSACAMGAPEGCNWMGDLVLHEGGDDAADWFGKACDRGLEDGCRNLAVHDDSSAEEQLAVWEAGCETDLRSCDFVARRRSEAGELTQAYELWSRACAGGILPSCDSAREIEGELR
jgi:TPR repeat protein